MPYSCARAVCRTFCAAISGALIPLFGPHFPHECIPENAPGYGRMVIPEEIVHRATTESRAMRAEAVGYHQPPRHHPMQGQVSARQGVYYGMGMSVSRLPPSPRPSRSVSPLPHSRERSQQRYGSVRERIVHSRRRYPPPSLRQYTSYSSDQQHLYERDKFLPSPYDTDDGPEHGHGPAPRKVYPPPPPTSAGVRGLPPQHSPMPVPSSTRRWTAVNHAPPQPTPQPPPHPLVPPLTSSTGMVQRERHWRPGPGPGPGTQRAWRGYHYPPEPSRSQEEDHYRQQQQQQQQQQQREDQHQHQNQQQHQQQLPPIRTLQAQDAPPSLYHPHPHQQQSHAQAPSSSSTSPSSSSSNFTTNTTTSSNTTTVSSPTTTTPSPNLNPNPNPDPWLSAVPRGGNARSGFMTGLTHATSTANSVGKMRREIDDEREKREVVFVWRHGRRETHGEEKQAFESRKRQFDEDVDTGEEEHQGKKPFTRSSKPHTFSPNPSSPALTRTQDLNSNVFNPITVNTWSRSPPADQIIKPPTEKDTKPTTLRTLTPSSPFSTATATVTPPESRPSTSLSPSSSQPGSPSSLSSARVPGRESPMSMGMSEIWDMREIARRAVAVAVAATVNNDAWGTQGPVNGHSLGADGIGRGENHIHREEMEMRRESEREAAATLMRLHGCDRRSGEGLDKSTHSGSYSTNNNSRSSVPPPGRSSHQPPSAGCSPNQIPRPYSSTPPSPFLSRSSQPRSTPTSTPIAIETAPTNTINGNNPRSFETGFAPTPTTPIIPSGCAGDGTKQPRSGIHEVVVTGGAEADRPSKTSAIGGTTSNGEQNHNSEVENDEKTVSVRCRSPTPSSRPGTPTSARSSSSWMARSDTKLKRRRLKA